MAVKYLDYAGLQTYDGLIKQYIGNNFQPLDSKLTSISGLSASKTGLIKITNGVASVDENTYLTGITSSDVISALGYTPYNSTNPNGYTSNAGTVTSVRVQAGTGLVSSQSTAQNTTLNTTISIASGYILPTTTEWNSKADASSLPTKTSDLTNDSGFITNATNGLTNYYKKSETYTQSEVDALVSAIPKFSIEVVNALPTTDISSTTVYLLKTSTTETGNLYTEYIYVNNAWESLGTQTVDLTNYATLNGNNVFTGTNNFSNGIGNGTYTYTLPSANGTLALTSQIPTNNNQLTNGAGYITASYLTAITDTEINTLFA